MKKFFSITGLLALCMLIMLPAMTSCDDDDKYNTEQYKGGVSLNVFGPSPVARGGELRFLGSGMDQVTKITIPGAGDITDIKVVSSTEIRVVVPQTAQPGTVVLHHAGGTIETKTLLTYLEPISIESIEPLRVKPGEELTIKGEYLNLINEVCFSFLEDSVNVYADAFTAHERGEIKVIVPEEAVSGTIYLSDAKEIPNMIESEHEVEVVLPATTPLDLTGARGGDLVTIEGTDLDLVRLVLLPDGSELDFDYADGKITFTLPENVTDGTIVMVPASGVKVACANIGVVEPTELEAVPADGLRAGDVLKIKGVNIDQVESLVFAGMEDAVAPATISATELTVAFPEAAQSGDVVLNLKSGKTVSVAVATAKPEVLAFEPAEVPAAAEFTMKGKNLDLVVAITFAGGTKVEVSGVPAAEYTMIAPATAETGALTLHMANGESVETSVLTIKAPECAYITVQPEGELTAYGLFIATLANEDKLTGVQVNGADVNYILNNGQLYITLPGTCGKNTTVTLVSSNGEISYTYDVTPATHQERVLINETHDLGSWTGEADGGAFRIYKEQLEGVPAGAKLVFYIESYAYTQIQLNDANWSSFEMLQCNAGEQDVLSYEFTEETLNQVLTVDDGWSTTAMVIQGEGCKVNKVTVEWEMSLEETIWSGEWTNSGWGGNQDLAWGGYDWSTVKAGTILRLYMTPAVADGEWWCVSLRHGDSWGNLPGDAASQIDTPAGGVAELVLTQEILDDLVANGGLVITGDGYTLNKVTLE